MITVATTAALLGLPGFSSAAEVRPSEVASRIQSIQKALDSLAASLERAEQDYNAAQAAADRHRKEIATAASREDTLRKNFAGHAAAMYTLGSGSTIETILSSRDMAEAVDRFSYLEQIHSNEQGMLEELTGLQRRSGIETAELDRALKQAGTAWKDLLARRSELMAKLREYQSLANILNALGGGKRRLSRAPNGFVCPVAGPHYVSNNFGQPRPGGPHTGDDIQSDYGVPAVAVLPATVSATPSGGWIGIGIIIRDAAGNEWWYAHLGSRYVSVGQHVNAGQMIGRVGCSGRCYGPHLHFEYHPGGGDPANPYGILSDAC